MLFGVALLWLVARWKPLRVSRIFGRLQVLSAAFMAFSHAVLPYFGLWFYLALTSLWRRFENADARLQATA